MRFFSIGLNSSIALIDPLLLVGHKVRRYVIDFVGFPPRNWDKICVPLIGRHKRAV